jgi:hypothetical protein
VLLTEATPLMCTKQIITALAGEFQSNRPVLLQDKVLLEIIHTTYMEGHACQVFIGTCTYDIIFEQDFLQKIHFHNNFDKTTMNCMDMAVPMQYSDFFSKFFSDFSLIALVYAILWLMKM